MLHSERLVDLRQRRRLSQEGLAKRLGRSQQYVYQLEHGLNPDIRVSTLLRLAEALDCSTDYLLGKADHALPIPLARKTA